MSLRTRLRIWIVTLVTTVVVAISAMYFYDFTTLAYDSAQRRADLVASQVRDYVLERLDQQTVAPRAHPVTLAESKRVWTEILQTDPAIRAMLTKALTNSDTVVDIHISGDNGVALAGTTPHLAGDAGSGFSFDEIKDRNPFRNVWDLLTRNENYFVSIPLGVPGQSAPLFRVFVTIRSSLLWTSLRTPIHNLGLAFMIAFTVAVTLAYALPGFVLGPLERLSQRIDLLRSEEFGAKVPQLTKSETSEFAAVESKLDMLGQQFRGAKQDTLELRGNVEEMLQRLEEAVLLFDPSERVMIAGPPAERLLGKGKGELVGRHREEVFPTGTFLGALIYEAKQRQESVRDRVVSLRNDGRPRSRVLVNVEMLRSAEDREIGTLVTLRDVDTRRQVQRQLDLSSRLAAIGRLTSGVAHEIKNPLNAMALHVELLRSKLQANDPEISVILKEIKRLDNVVKTFLNFTKPVELQAKPLDATALVSEIVDLIAPEALAHGVAIERNLDAPHWIAGDADLLKQALLNVIVNALEAIRPEGGKLTVGSAEVGSSCVLTVRDNGYGIPPEVQDKIFNLYFTTKEQGSGIGLATTFRLVQLHGGSIELVSKPGEGTLFRLRFPSLTAGDQEHVITAHS